VFGRAVRTPGLAVGNVAEEALRIADPVERNLETEVGIVA